MFPGFNQIIKHAIDTSRRNQIITYTLEIIDLKAASQRKLDQKKSSANEW